MAERNTLKRKRPKDQRHKAPKERKGEEIRIRTTAEQKKKLRAAADREGLGVSTWLLAAGLRAAEARARQEEGAE